MPLAARRALLRWYRLHGRHDLPWRGVRNPWHVLLAELMLQRTRADLVAPVYLESVSRWPTAASFAEADPEEVQHVLRPLGLTHRVRRLQRAAEHFSGGVPRSYQRLVAGPGVGPYAATATLCFAYGRRIAVVDPSVIRFLERFLGLRSSRARTEMTLFTGRRPLS